MNSNISQSRQQIIDSDPGLNVVQISDEEVFRAGLRKLRREKVDSILSDNLRNGFQAQARKKYMRAQYAKTIRDTEGRDVRPYTHYATDEERKRAKQKQYRESKKRARAAMTPEQKAAEQKRQAEAYQHRKKQKEEAAKQALQDRAIF
nr:hypothetical protein [Brucella anthropi]